MNNNGAILFIFEVETERTKGGYPHRVDIMADNSCEAFTKCCEYISEHVVNITNIKLIYRSDK